ncbi:YoaK family protein [Nocardioides endophyticus]|uniref:YoaK family protein n=1 Tax=Nocardioides endophyticus TaxID=1353775 RepID=A0ABP8YDY2_9ACTN
MLALTFSTGIIDAVGYLGLDRVFTGNMTGNVVIMGMAMAGGDGLPVLGPTLALVGFMLGAAAAGRALRGGHPGWSSRTTRLLLVVGAMMAGVSVTLFAVGDDLTQAGGVAVTTVLGAAMGLQAAAARVVAVKDVTTVVVTSTITGLAADSVFGGGIPGGGVRRVAAVVLILVGAGVGALAITWHLGVGPMICAVLTVAVAVAGRGLARTP